MPDADLVIHHRYRETNFGSIGEECRLEIEIDSNLLRSPDETFFATSLLAIKELRCRMHLYDAIVLHSDANQFAIDTLVEKSAGEENASVDEAIWDLVFAPHSSQTSHGLASLGVFILKKVVADDALWTCQYLDLVDVPRSALCC